MRKVGITGDLKVSPVGLGTVNFGTGLSEADSMDQMDRYLEVGNLIDTAHVYGDWEPGVRGRSERVIGKWLSLRGGRDRVIISTKGAHPRLESMDIPRVTPEAIRRDLEESLRCLNTEYVDLYFLHRDDPARPVGESLECLERLRGEGKIRAYGCSNWRLDRILEAERYAKAHSLSGFVCNQLMWSLAAVDMAQVADKTLVGMDGRTYAWHRRSQMAAMAYMSVANGYFDHLAAGDLREAVRIKYGLPINAVIHKRLCELSAKTGMSLTALSLLYFSAAPFPAVALASFSSPKQMEACTGLLQREAPLEIARELEGLRTDLRRGE